VNGWRRDGVLERTRYVASPNCDARPPGVAVSLLVLHSISLPPGEYGGDAVERLFTNRLDCAAHPAFRELAGLRVSAHFFLRRNGERVQFVPLPQRAWHAGVSRWRGRARCNDFSIGVELEGTDRDDFSAPQYDGLAALVCELRRALPIREVAAHSEIAPARKTDPGRGFDWAKLHARLAQR
jgi:AmpD protein